VCADMERHRAKQCVDAMAPVEAVLYQVNAMTWTDGEMLGGASYEADALCKRFAFMR
jgi:hypothetical protein